MKKRISAMLLSVVLLLSLLPTAALAAEGEEDPTPSTPSVEAGKALLNDTVYDKLEEAVTAAQSGDTIYLGTGKYTLYQKGADAKNKDLTFIGQGTETEWGIGATIPDPDKFGTEYNGDYSFDGAGSVTFKDMTLQSGTADYLGFIRADNTVVENCTINGKTFYWGYTSATFKDTTFNCPSYDYALWTYSSPTMTFDGCTFNSSGKVINVYRDYEATAYTINFNDCTVKNAASGNWKESPQGTKQVLNINDSVPSGQTYTINITGTNTITGSKILDCDKISCSRLFGFGGKSSNNAGNTTINMGGTYDAASNTVTGGTTVWENGAMVDANAMHQEGLSPESGSYDNGIESSNDSLYAEGYKDSAFTITTTTQGKRTVTTKTCDYCGWSEESSTYAWDVSRSKKATDLDSSKRSTVTLSLPSAEETLSSDIVFVLDQSSCATAVAKMMPGLFESLDKEIAETGADINVGVVVFRGNAQVAYDLAKYKAENQTAISTAVVATAAGMTLKGTNMPSGLLAAQQMLDASSTDTSRQYMILVSDGATYVYTHDGDPTSHYGRTSGYWAMDGSLYEWAAKYDPDLYGSNSDQYALPSSFTNNGDVSDWENFLNDIGTKRDAFTKYDQEYTRVGSGTANLAKPDPVCTAETIKDFIINGEESMYQAAAVYKQLVAAGVNCYSIRTSDAYGAFTSFSKYLGEIGEGEGTDFSQITNDILYAVGVGSTVEDKMGSEFDLVAGTFKLTVGDTELPVKQDGDTYYFGDTEDSAATEASETNWRFKVVYDAAKDSFVWTINEAVSNFAAVQLSYTIKLVNPKTAAGTYEEPTNEYAVLTPKDSAGNDGETLEFEVPIVSYTVKNSGGGGGGGSTSYILTYESNGGTSYKSESYSSGTTVQLNKVPSREGYTFTGWYADKALTNKITSIKMTSSKTVYAGWDATGVPDMLNGDDHFAYVIGYSDGTVRPNDNISRAEVATIFFRLLKADIRDGNLTSANTFTDVTADMWCNKSISTMASLGIVKGRTANFFDPDANITRAEFAAICARFDTNRTDGDSSFTDISGHWAEAEIERAATLGWIQGYSDHTFRPDNYITRAEAMTMINRVLNRLPEDTSDLLPDMKTWPDNSDTSVWYYLAVQEATNSHDFKHKNEVNETWTEMNTNPDWTRYQ